MVMANSNNKKCFVIMPISDADGYDKGHFNRVYEYLIDSIGPNVPLISL